MMKVSGQFLTEFVRRKNLRGRTGMKKERKKRKKRKKRKRGRKMTVELVGVWEREKREGEYHRKKWFSVVAVPSLPLSLGKFTSAKVGLLMGGH
jgi:hypothetical protein